ncbi:hypothetical protein [Providencia rettgeri]|uniref:hypothetical protein n=1 Tax=Providencia rettgeri TaxID=587 RepID=UPI0020474D82|nr:hypothetical protein [Providencia rettgeri]UPS61473.1 hypothetical protein M0M83_12615 [Providencia rettgeri]
MISTFNKSHKSLGSIKSQDIYKEIDYSTILSISKKPPTNTIYLEKTYQSVRENVEQNSINIRHLMNKIDYLKRKFKTAGSDELNELKNIEHTLSVQAENQEKNFEALQFLHSKQTNKQGYYTISEISESMSLNKSHLIDRYEADLLSLQNDMEDHFISPDEISHQKNPIILNAISSELNQINANLNNSYHLSRKYLHKTTENMQSKLTLMQKALYAEGDIHNLYNDAKESKNNVEKLLKKLNNDGVMHSASNNTINKLIKHTTKLNTQYAKIQYLHHSFDKIKSFEYLDDVHNHIEQDNGFNSNYLEKNFKNNKEFKLLTELSKSIDNLKTLKINAQKKLDNHILSINALFTYGSDRQTKYQQDIQNKLEKLFDKIELRINIEMKKDAGLYYDQSTYLIHRSQLERNILNIKEDLENYIIENRLLAQEKNTRDNIEELATQFSDEFLRTKTLQKFINLEFNNHLQQFSQPKNKLGSYINNFGENTDNIYMLAVEKKLLKNEINSLISNIRIKIPLKSASSTIDENTYYQTVQYKMYSLLNLTEQLGALSKLYDSKGHSEIREFINDIHALEKQIAQTEKEISLYIYTHSENKDKKSISSEVTPLLIELINKKTKIISIETTINKNSDKINLNVVDNDGNDKDLGALLSSIIAEFPQDTIASDVNHQPLHNKSMPIFAPSQY